VCDDREFHLRRLAWFGGAFLFFITWTIPVQFDRQWITLGLALEGAALLWLFLRVPHNGLRWLGFVLLALAFIRLALNPAVLTYQVRGDTPLLNWHLYTYLIAAVCMALGAWWMRAPHHQLREIPARACLWTFCGILLFLLVNIQIADYFTSAGERYIAFQFSGNFARDMSYSIAWALFALSLIAVGFWQQVKPARLAGIGLLAVTFAKLFMHDLAAIGSGYRIAALMVVAVIGLAASYLYQRFFDSEAVGVKKDTDAV
jgi:uncharacterized membrane protein